MGTQGNGEQMVVPLPQPLHTGLPFGNITLYVMYTLGKPICSQRVLTRTQSGDSTKRRPNAVLRAGDSEEPPQGAICGPFAPWQIGIGMNWHLET